MTKHRRTRRKSQKGGEYQVPNSQSQGWFSGITSGIKGFFSSGVEKVKEGLVSTNQFIGDTAQSTANAVSDVASNVVDTVSAPFSSSSDTTNPNQTEMYGNPSQSGMTLNSYRQQAGRRKKRCKSMKGGKGGSNLAYYAAPVSGLKVAEPTTWQYYANGVNQYSVKGGARKRRRTRRHKKY